jgi:hypothetical protein
MSWTRAQVPTPQPDRALKKTSLLFAALRLCGFAALRLCGPQTQFGTSAQSFFLARNEETEFSLSLGVVRSIKAAQYVMPLGLSWVSIA